MIVEKKTPMTEKEYRKIPMLSSSDLQAFIKDRRKFYEEVVLAGKSTEEEYSKAKLIGNLVHCLILEPEEFESRFMLTTVKNPPTAMMLIFVESLFKHTKLGFVDGEQTQEFESLIALAYEASGYKITQDAVLKKFTTMDKHGDKPQDYFEQLMKAWGENKEVVCVDDITIAEKVVQQLKEDEFVGPLFTADKVAFNELKVDGFDIFGLEMKGMIDRPIVDHDAKTIQPYDLKVTYDVVNFKREYFLKKRTHIQAYVYWMALKSGKADLGFDYSEYEILPLQFIVAHSGCFYKPLIYELGAKGMVNCENGFEVNGIKYPGVKEIVEDILWCQETGNWAISKNNFENSGIVGIFD